MRGADLLQLTSTGRRTIQPRIHSALAPGPEHSRTIGAEDLQGRRPNPQSRPRRRNRSWPNTQRMNRFIHFWVSDPKESPMPTQQTREAPAGANKPVHTCRHRNIKATIWKNDTSNGTMYNVNVVRSYHDDNGEWKDSHSIG